MSNFYIVIRGYYPNTAATIHCLNWIKYFDLMHVKAEVDVLRYNDNLTELPNVYRNITIDNIWKKNIFHPRNRTLRFLTHMYNSYLFSKKLKEGDKVWIYDCPEVLPILVRKKGVEVYSEVTEHPDVKGIRFLGKRCLHAIDLAYKKLSGLFVISNSLKFTFRERGVNENKIHIINMTVDPGRFEGLKKNENCNYIAYCGNGANNKDGVDLLIKSFAIFNKKVKGYKLLIIGPESVYGDSSGNKELVDSLGLASEVVFTGRKSSEEVPQLLTDAKILALARPDSLQAQNGFPSKLGEYLLTGNPVVVTAVGDIPNFLEDGVSAKLAVPGDVENFADCLLWIHEHYKDALAVGQKGKEVALNRFNPTVEAQKMLEIMNIQ